MRNQRRRREQAGAVLVEAAIATSMLAFMFFCVVFMYRLGLEQMETGEEARLQAWSRAMAGCVDNDFGPRDLVTALRQGDLPLPASFLGGGDAEVTVARSSLDVLRNVSRTVSSSVQIPCNTRVSNASESAAGNWLLDIF